MKPKAYSYIRFSRPEQIKGDSLRRQIETSERYARAKGLVLDQSLSMQDWGLSAYHGAHKEKGALGQFLKLVELGKIARGSVLIVESLDRLSREDVMVALNQFSGLIDAGIRIVTLQDNMEYDKESIKSNWTQLIISISIMARAHEESEIKSQRLKSAWEKKRKEARSGERKLTKQAPAWLRLSENRTKYQLIPERAAVIKLIYEMKAVGKGNYSIEKELNSMTDIWKPTGRDGRQGWRQSYIQKILQGNREIIGEYQPYRKIRKDGKQIREKDGEPIADYFPAAIDRKLYNRVQALIAANKNKPGRGGGKTGKITNLFTHIMRCPYCGGPMAYVNKGKEEWQYFVCDTGRRGMGCDKTSYNYPRVESAFLSYCRGLNPNDILPNNKKAEKERTILHHNIEDIKQEIWQIDLKLSNLFDSISNTKDKALRKELEKRASLLLKDKAKLESREKDLTAEMNKLVSSSESTEEHLKDIRELIDYMQKAGEEKRIELRKNLRNQLQKLIEEITISRFGEDKEGGIHLTVKYSSGVKQMIWLYDNGEILHFARTKPAKAK